MKVKISNRYVEKHGCYATLIKVPNTQIKVWMPIGLVFEGKHETTIYFPKGKEFHCLNGRKETTFDASILFNRFSENIRLQQLFRK